MFLDISDKKLLVIIIFFRNVIDSWWDVNFLLDRYQYFSTRRECWQNFHDVWSRRRWVVTSGNVSILHEKLPAREILAGGSEGERSVWVRENDKKNDRGREKERESERQKTVRDLNPEWADLKHLDLICIRCRCVPASFVSVKISRERRTDETIS